MKTALKFAQAKYKRTDKSTYRGTSNPQNVLLQDQVKLLELLHEAKKVAGETVYGKRIDVILGELPELSELQERYTTLQKEGDPRDEAMQIEASNWEDRENATTFRLEETLTRTWGNQVSKPELDT